MKQASRPARQSVKHLDDYWTLTEAAEQLTISERQAKDFMQANAIEIVRDGDKHWVRKDFVHAAIAKNARATAEETKKRFTSFDQWSREAHTRAKASARKRGIPFLIEIQDLRDLAATQKGRCAVTSLRFSKDTLGYSTKRPWMPIVDRIDSRLGYTPDNIRLVAVAANLAMGAWGDEVLYKMADAICRNRQAQVQENRRLVTLGVTLAKS